MPKLFSERGGRTGSGAWIAIGATAILLTLMPLVLCEYSLLILCYVLVFALACLGLNLLFGTTGLLSLWGALGFGETSGCGRRNGNWRTKEWIHRLPMMSVRSRQARRSAPIELAEASPSAGRRGDFQRSGNSKLSAG